MVVYPLEFHRRSEQKWRRKAASSVQIEHAETPTRRSDQCPRCCILAVTPLVSVHRPGGDIAHHWKCKNCEFDWDTIFRRLFVECPDSEVRHSLRRVLMRTSESKGH